MSTDQPLTLSVLGGGSFGTALAQIAAENGHRVNQWMRSAEQAERICRERENRRYLPGLRLHDNLHPGNRLEVVAESDLVLVAIPSRNFRRVARQAAAHARPGQMLVSTTKGIEGESFKLMSQILREEVPEARIGVLSGPNLAKEIATRQLAAAVIASDEEAVCQRVQNLLHCDYFRVYAGRDVYGVELGGALKNIYAIAAGLCAALDLGENTRAMLVTRSLAEMSRFAVRMGADPLTFLGLAGVGDLMVTCMSPLSRNYRVGFALGQGRELEEIIADLGEVAEGVNTLSAVKAEADRRDVYMPLVQGLHRVVFEGEPLRRVIGDLMMGVGSDDVAFQLAPTKPEG